MLSAHSKVLLDTWRVDVTLDGPTPPPGVGCVVCYNESSFADVFAYPLSIWPYVDRSAAADSYEFIPYAKAAMETAQIEPVPRGNRNGTDALIQRMVEAVRAGDRLTWGGEGGLSGIDGVKRFRIGAALIAIQAGAPIVPLAFFGGHYTLRLGSGRGKPGTSRARFGTPIPTDGLTVDDARALMGRVQREVTALYDALRLESGFQSPKLP